MRKIVCDKCTHYNSKENKKPCNECLRELILWLSPKTGHWIMIDEELQRYKCSECGEIIRIYDNETLKGNYRFSHCGAKMESEDN